MNNTSIVRAIETMPRQLLQEIDAELKSNLGTSHYHRLNKEELSKRHAEVFQAIVDWLVFHQESSLRQKAEILGRRRFLEGVPLGQVVLALILIEKKMVIYFATELKEATPEVQASLTEFFQKYAYYTARGYEVLLSEVNHPAHEAARTESQGNKRKPTPDNGKIDMAVSRGGDVGEVAG